MKKNKGFTLVEVIVILVILAILAAVLIPSLTTYIDKAKEKSVTANARAALIASQAMASEMYGLDFDTLSMNGTKLTTELPTEVPALADSMTDAKQAEYIFKLGQLDSVYKNVSLYILFEEGTVKGFAYQEVVNDKTYLAMHTDAGAWVVLKAASASVAPISSDADFTALKTAITTALGSGTTT